MNRKTLWLALLFVALIIGFVVYTTVGAGRYTCEVCMVYQGRRACRTASAGSREQAQRTATENACAQIAAGMTESNQCENTQPESVKWGTGDGGGGTGD